MSTKDDQQAKQEEKPLPLTDLSQPAQFRMVMVSFLSAGIGLVAGVVAYALYQLIGLFTNLILFSPFFDGLHQRAFSSSRDPG
jgi:hypothetical protein